MSLCKFNISITKFSFEHVTRESELLSLLSKHKLYDKCLWSIPLIKYPEQSFPNGQSATVPKKQDSRLTKTEHKTKSNRTDYLSNGLTDYSWQVLHQEVAANAGFCKASRDFLIVWTCNRSKQQNFQTASRFILGLRTHRASLTLNCLHAPTVTIRGPPFDVIKGDIDDVANLMTAWRALSLLE